MAKKAKKKVGRKRGSQNKGYHFRKGRGWYALDGTRRVALCYPNGEHDRRTPVDIVKDACDRCRLALQAEKQAAEIETAAEVTLEEVCAIYLSYVKMTGAETTHYSRANTLFDFCYGFPAKFRRKDGQAAEYTPKEIKAMQQARCNHPAYGSLGDFWAVRRLERP